MPRTDQHRPVRLVTENYEYVGSFYHGPGSMFSDWSKELLKLVVSSTGTAYHSGSQCDHCGAHLKYVAVLKHIPSGDHLAVGETCLDNRFSQATIDFQRLRKAAELDRKAQKIKEAAAAFRAANPDLEEIFQVGATYNVEWFKKLERNLYTYGSLFPGQVEKALKVAREIPEKARLRAEREAAEALEIKGVVPEGSKLRFHGLVLSLKHVKGDFGWQTKMLLKVNRADGTVVKLYGTAPASLLRDEVKVGDFVRLTGNLTRSKDDEAFGFWSVPSQASISHRAENGEEK